MEEIFGYDIIEGQYVVNEQEAEVVKYYAEKYVEYSDNPPQEVIQAVFEELKERGGRKKITLEMAREQAKLSEKLYEFLFQEIREKFGEIIEKGLHKLIHRSSYFDAIANKKDKPVFVGESKPIIDIETFEKVKALSYE